MTATVHGLPTLEVHLSADTSDFTTALTALIYNTVVFARPADMPAPLLALAESMWDATPLDALLRLDDTDDLLATLLGLDTAEDSCHDELTRCQEEGCGTWFWADDGATVTYESGSEKTMCDVHAVADDPGARVYPGPRLEAEWRERDEAAVSARIRATGSAW